MSTRFWRYRDRAFGAALRGYEVRALDGRIGTVDEATDENHGRYVVVDTGPWILRKKAMLPASVVDRVDQETRTVYVNRTKEEIRNAPEFGEAGYDDDAYLIALGRYYGSGGAGFREPSRRESSG